MMPAKGNSNIEPESVALLPPKKQLTRVIPILSEPDPKFVQGAGVDAVLSAASSSLLLLWQLLDLLEEVEEEDLQARVMKHIPSGNNANH